MEDLQDLDEDTLVGVSVWVGDEDVHIPTCGLPPAVGAARHGQQAGVHRQGCLPHLETPQDQERTLAWTHGPCR